MAKKKDRKVPRNWNQFLRYIASQIEQGNPMDDPGVHWQPEAGGTFSGVMQPDGPTRDPFQPPPEARGRPMLRQMAYDQGPPRDARGVAIDPAILAAMDRARKARAEGTLGGYHGGTALDDFRKRGGYQRSPLWG